MSLAEDTYKGDTPAKKLARHWFWNRALQQPGQIPGNRILVLASWEMGDYSNIIARSSLASAVIAVDRCAASVEIAKRKFPEADVRCGDVRDVAELSSVGVAFLDFCSPICPEIVEVVRAVLDKMPVGGRLGVGLQKAREKHGRSVISTCVGRNRLERRALERRPIALALPPTALANVKASAERVHPALARPLALAELARTPLIGTKRLLLTDVVNYQSSTADKQGVPMSYALYSIVRSEAAKDGRNRLKETRHDCTFQEYRSVSLKQLRTEALRFDAMGVDASLLLNIPHSTVSAWKAHDTRGTYKEVAA